jgi:hypothetical protein
VKSTPAERTITCFGFGLAFVAIFSLSASFVITERITEAAAFNRIVRKMREKHRN